MIHQDVSRATNIQPYLGRDMRTAGKVKVHWNVNRKCWSITAVDGPCGGRVVAHADSIALCNAEFVVSEAGRQRVLRERRKNVHAWVVGELPRRSTRVRAPSFYIDVKYRPYECGQFMAHDPHGWPNPRWTAPAVSATHVHLGTDGRVRADGVTTAP